MKIALVCDFLTKLGGAQKVLLAFHEIYPDAPIYCLLYSEEGTRGVFKDCKIVESSLSHSWFRNRHKFLLPKLSAAIEEFDLSSYDIVLSSSDSFAHGVITKPKTLHICYCHTPMRYVWDWSHEYLKENNIGHGIVGLTIRSILHKIRIWDKVAADRVDKWLANSECVADRIAKFYRVTATVVYPPVDVEQIKVADSAPEDFYVIASRLEPYKGTRLAVEAFNKNGKKLVIIGEGSQKRELQRIAKDNITFLGWKDPKFIYDYLHRAKAFVFPVEDDFGIAPVEAMAAGRPVIAFSKGGALESVVDGKTGVFFKEMTSDSLSDAVDRLESIYDRISIIDCQTQAEKFSRKLFLDRIKKEVEQGYAGHQKGLK